MKESPVERGGGALIHQCYWGPIAHSLVTRSHNPRPPLKARGAALLIGITALLPASSRPLSRARTNLLVLSRQQTLHYLAEVVEGGSLLRLAVPALHHDLVAAKAELRVSVGLPVVGSHPADLPGVVDMGPWVRRKLTLHW